VYPCAPVCASAAAAALRVWSIAPSSPLRDPGNPARTPLQPRSRALAIYTRCTQLQSKASWLASAPEATVLPPGCTASTARVIDSLVFDVSLAEASTRIPADTDATCLGFVRRARGLPVVSHGGRIYTRRNHDNEHLDGHDNATTAAVTWNESEQQGR